jgi:SH3 domain-containing YSC84-like protein 1
MWRSPAFRGGLLGLGGLLAAGPGLADDHGFGAADLATLETLVQEAQATVDRFHAGEAWGLFLETLGEAHGVVIAPDLLKAGLIVAGETGRGVLLARHPESGEWSYPAFVELTSGSVGWQVGVQVSEVVFVVRTPGGLERLLADSIKMGVDAGLAVAGTGGGIEGSTTMNLDADIVALSMARGAFAGIALKGALLEIDEASNALYYGQPVSLDDIVQGRATNPQADPLRLTLAALPPPLVEAAQEEAGDAY